MRGGGKVSKLVIVSGNGGGDVMRANWYASALRELSKALPHITVVCPQMPESEVAPEAVWVPHLLSLGVDHETVLVGHSSGACAATRLAEKHKLHTLVLVSACHTDQGDENERLSGYYNRPWLWDDIKANVANQIIQFASKDDPLIPFATEQMHVHKMLDTNLVVFEKRGHIWDKTFPELVEMMVTMLK